MKITLNHDERYVIACYLSDRIGTTWMAMLIVRVLVGCLFAYGLYKNDQGIVFTAFGTLLAIDLYGQSRTPKFARSTRSAFEKMEARIAELEHLQEKVEQVSHASK